MQTLEDNKQTLEVNMQTLEDNVQTLEDNGRKRREWWHNRCWMSLCFFYVVTFLTGFGLYGIAIDVASYIEPPNHKTVDQLIAYGYNISPINKAVLRDPFGIDSRYWGHVYQSAASIDIATALEIEPDRVFFRGKPANKSLSHDTIRVEFINPDLSVIRLRTQGKALGPSERDLEDEFIRQVKDPLSPLYTTEFGKQLKAAQYPETELVVERSLILSKLEIGFYSIRDNSNDLLPHETVPTSFYSEERNPDLNPFYTIILGLFGYPYLIFSLPLVMLLMSNVNSGCMSCMRVNRDDIAYFKYHDPDSKSIADRLKRTHPRNVLLGTTAGFAILIGLCSFFKGIPFITNWYNDPPLPRVVDTPAYWSILFFFLLCHQLLALFLVTISTRCCSVGT